MLTPRGRAMYVKVFKPALNKLSKKMEYSMLLHFPKGTDITPLIKECQRVRDERWAPVNGVVKKVAMPFHKAEEKAEEGPGGKLIFPEGFEAGGVYMTMRADPEKGPGPEVCDENKQPILDMSEFYSGCWCRASVGFYAYDYGKPGVGTGLRNIQRLGKDKSLTGRTTAEQDFEAVDIEGGAEAGVSADDVFNNI
jgi:hypothetical protein